MHTKKHLSPESLIHGFRKILDSFPERRSGIIDYSRIYSLTPGRNLRCRRRRRRLDRKILITEKG